jgi:hypothetical protein
MVAPLPWIAGLHYPCCVVGLKGRERLDEVQRGMKFQSLPSIKGVSDIRPLQFHDAMANCYLGGMGSRL